MLDFEQHRRHIAGLVAEQQRLQHRTRLITGALWAVLAAALVMAVAGAVLSHRAAQLAKSATLRNGPQ